MRYSWIASLMAALSRLKQAWWGCIVVPCSAPGITTNSSNLPALLSVLANLGMFLVYRVCVVYYRVCVVYYRVCVVYYRVGYLVASVMKLLNSDSQMMVGGILDRVASSALSGNNRFSDFMSSN